MPLPAFIGPALQIAGAASVPLMFPGAVESLQGLSDRHFGTDWGHGRRRANLLADAQWRALMADEVDTQGDLAYEKVLNDLLSPLAAVQPWDGLTGVKNFIQQRELNDVVARDQMRLGSLAQVYQDNSFEALAMKMGL